MQTSIVNDVTQAHGLLHGEETDVFGDAGDQGADKREENQGVAVTWQIALRPVKRRALAKTTWGGWMKQIEQVKARMGPWVELSFHVKMFHHRKTRFLKRRMSGKFPRKMPCFVRNQSDFDHFYTKIRQPRMARL